MTSTEELDSDVDSDAGANQDHDYAVLPSFDAMDQIYTVPVSLLLTDRDRNQTKREFTIALLFFLRFWSSSGLF